jgi:amidase
MKMKIILLLFCLSFFLGCAKNAYKEKFQWTPYDQAEELSENIDHPIRRMQYKLIQSKFLDKNKVWESAYDQLKTFSDQDYEALFPFIYEKTIPEIQSSITLGLLTYEKLTQWYLYRILKYESNPYTSLHSIIAINPNAVQRAIELDNKLKENQHLIYGMPILLKDNINFQGLPTTAGAVVLKDNNARDAFIVERLESNGAIILGKANLSEWAYFFCGGCPVGYSAIGGQTLNPYGRKIFETGGSSSGSGTTMAANYAAGAVGTETSGSILSPSSQNSIVGLKPTIGLLSRSGIVPISSTLDTPGPMTRSVTDNAILLSAMVGEDLKDQATFDKSKNYNYHKNLEKSSLKSIRLGAIKSFIERDSVYKSTIAFLEEKNVEVLTFDPESIRLNGFTSILNLDMKVDLPKYLSEYADKKVSVTDVPSVINFNNSDTTLFAPYGQARLQGIIDDTISNTELSAIKSDLERAARTYFDNMMDPMKVDAMLSINNSSAGYAAVAKYPALTVPMGYRQDGQPVNLTFIGKPFSEEKLLQIGYAFEKLLNARKPPVLFTE